MAYFCEECNIIIDDDENIEITCAKFNRKNKFRIENINKIEKFISSSHEGMVQKSEKINVVVKSEIISFIQKTKEKIDLKFEFLAKRLNYLDDLEKSEQIKKSYNTILKEIIKEIIKEEKTEEEILNFIKLLLLKSLNNYDNSIDIKNITIMKKYFFDKISQFQNKIIILTKKATNLCINLSDEEKNDLKKFIKELFSPVNKDIDRIKKYKYFIEKYINFSELLNKYISKEHCLKEDNYINIDEVLSDYSNLKKPFNSKNPDFILSLLSKFYEKIGIKIYVTEENDNKMKNIEIASIQSLFSVMAKKNYEIHFNLGERQNQKILNDKSEQIKFIEDMKKKFSQILKINEDKIVFTNIRHGCVRGSAYIIDCANENPFQNLSTNDRERLNITRIVETPIFDTLQINESILDPLGDRDIGWWGVGEQRGGNEYIPPLDGWVGIGLSVLNKYDNGNNDWLAYENIRGEFSIGYIGIYNLWNDKNRIIYDLNEFSRDINIMERNNLYYSNIFNYGDGICVFQNPEYAENSTGYIEILGYKIKILLMCRVNPRKIRICDSPPCWILNPTSDEIRPYRILVKKIPISSLSNDDKITTSIEPIDYIIDAINSNDFSFYNLPNTESLNYNRIKGLNYSNEKFVLKLYSSPGQGLDNQKLNNYLRTKTVELFSEKELKSWICCLHNAIKHGNNKVQNDIEVYRGINRQFPEEIGIGSKFYFREFISTSLNRQIAEIYLGGSGTLLVITIKNNGINGQNNYCLKIDDISEIPDEEEVLITCNCYFTVTNIEKGALFDIVYLICEGYKFD